MKKLISILICLLLVVGCGPGFVYPHLDWLVPWHVDDYISLNSDQSSMLKSRLMQQLDWHCRTQLAVYAESLRDLTADFENSNPPVTYAVLQSHYDRLMEHWKDLMRQIAPDVSDILLTATDEQIRELFSNLEKQNRELKIKYLDPAPDELLESRQKRMIKRSGVLDIFSDDGTETGRQGLESSVAADHRRMAAPSGTVSGLTFAAC